jgi:hypothetical protein
VFGPLPGHAQTANGQADGVQAQHAGRPAPGVADLGHQAQCPGTAGLAEGSGALVQQMTQGLVEGRVEDRSGAVGARGLLLQGVQPFGREGVDDVADRGGGAAERPGDAGRRLTVGAGQQGLATAQGEGIRRAQPLLEVRANGKNYSVAADKPTMTAAVPEGLCRETAYHRASAARRDLGDL